VRVMPGAPRDQVVGLAEGVWRVKVAAPPVGGKANDRLVRFLADVLNMPPGMLAIDHGHTSRRKVLVVTGLGPEEVAARLAQVAVQ